MCFKDTAEGIPSESLENIFEPFFATKEEGTSIGLGLYFCKQAIEKMQGEISCSSEYGEFALFTIKFKKAV